ncbi:hypothetical protein [Luteimonas sp. A482]
MKSILASVLLLSSSVATTSTISDSELSLAGVALGDSEAQVLAMLGPAPKRSETGEGTVLEYGGLTVLVGWLEQQAPGEQRRVFQLKATAPNACTPAGLCPGTPAAKVVATYGQPVHAERESGSFLEYYSHQSSCWLQVDTSGEIIRSISAVCQP